MQAVYCLQLDALIQSLPQFQYENFKQYYVVQVPYVSPNMFTNFVVFPDQPQSQTILYQSQTQSHTPPVHFQPQYDSFNELEDEIVRETQPQPPPHHKGKQPVQDTTKHMPIAWSPQEELVLAFRRIQRRKMHIREIIFGFAFLRSFRRSWIKMKSIVPKTNLIHGFEKY